MSLDDVVILTGNANPQLAKDVCKRLDIPLGKAFVGTFSDGEIQVELIDNVRGKDVFVLQSTCAPPNRNLMEALVLVDACKRASALRVTAALPYFGYARQDRKPRNARVSITAKLVANMITASGADRVLTIDLHADQIQGFFDIPCDNLYGSLVLLSDIWSNNKEGLMVVSPDTGGVVRARAMAKHLDDAELAIIDKRRPKPNESKVMNIIGDVNGRNCVIVDDLVDTANTLAKAADALKEAGAESVKAYCTHPVLSGGAVSNIESSGLDELVVTDTIPLRKDAAACKKIRQLSVAQLLAESIRRVANEDSVSALFVE